MSLDFALRPSTKHHHGYILVSVAAADPRWMRDTPRSAGRVAMTVELVGAFFLVGRAASSICNRDIEPGVVSRVSGASSEMWMSENGSRSATLRAHLDGHEARAIY